LPRAAEEGDTVAGEAELVFVGGGVYTVDAARPWARAVAVRGGRIVHVGTEL
jgi:predicted amidohydrolase YtcJ